MRNPKAVILQHILPFVVCCLCFLGAKSQHDGREGVNLIGERASDFSFMLNGEKQTLNQILEEKNTKILILFHSPDCEDCSKTKKKLANNKGINKALEAGTLSVLAVAVETDSLKWDSTCSFLPSKWLNGYCTDCEEIIESYIWTVPTLFLTDKNGIILNRGFKPNEKNNYN